MRNLYAEPLCEAFIRNLQTDLFAKRLFIGSLRGGYQKGGAMIGNLDKIQGIG